MGNPLLKSANPGATAVNNAGSGHNEVDGNPLLDRKVGEDESIPMVPEHQQAVEGAGMHYIGTVEGMVWFNEPSGSTLVYKLSKGNPTPEAITAEVERWKSQNKIGAKGKLSPNSQAAWDAIQASGVSVIQGRHGTAGAVLPDGTTIHKHTMSALERAGLVEVRVEWMDEAGNVLSDDEMDRASSMHREWVVKQPKTGREIMHDDSGAQTGLRRRPDYGESDSFTSVMNRENSKYAVAVQGADKTAAIKERMYVASVEWDGMAVKEARLTANVNRAMELPWYTARKIARELPKLHPDLRTSLITKE